MAGIDKHLQIGQTVCLREHSLGYQVAAASPGEAGPQVAEIGPDYVVFDNADAGVKTRVPVHLLSLAVPPAATAPPAAPPEPEAVAPPADAQPVATPQAA